VPQIRRSDDARIYAFNDCDLSIMRFMRAVNTEVNVATAPSKNAGAATCVMTCDSCATDGVSRAIGSLLEVNISSGPQHHPIAIPILDGAIRLLVVGD
jgi:hypothetical protein